MSVSIAAEWSELYNRFYRKQEVYSMCWQGMDLSRFMVACARYGGPIAVVRDESKVLLLGKEAASPKVQIFTSSGIQLAWFHWDKGRVVQMGWTDDLVLIIVCEDAYIYQYNIHGEVFAERIYLGMEAMDQLIVSACIWSTGVVCLTEQNQLFAVTNFKDPKPTSLGNPNLEEPPHCMAVIEPKHTKSGNLEVLLAVGASVIVIEGDSVVDQALTVGPITKMAVSPNGTFIACFTYDSRLIVMQSDFSKSLSEFTTDSSLPPDQVVWCGLDSVLLYWDETLLMVGPFGDSCKYSYDEPLVLIQENDAVRILSDSTMEILQRVPDTTTSIFKIGSTDPAAMLYDALEHYDKRSAKADINIRAIGHSLSEAVEACIDAAGHEFDQSQQRALLRAAAYGRAFCESFPKERFREMCKAIRVLNAVRHFEVGIPLTYQQYKMLTPPVLITRLVNAHRHLLALRISKYLGLSQDTVLVQWAKAKISLASELPDDQVSEILVKKLGDNPAISYAAIAAHAHSSGRRQLAAKLLDNEPRAGEQVPLLASIGEDERALYKAIDSGDTDLVYFSLFHLWRQKTVPELFKIVQSKPQARDLFILYARQNDPELLKQFYMTTSYFQGAADIVMRESWEITKDRQVVTPGRGSALQHPRQRLLDQAHDLYGRARDCAFQAKAAEEAARLLKVQQELEVSEGQAIFVDSSVSDTIRTLITIGNHRMAQRIRSDFKVPEKRWYFLKIKALATIGDFDTLEKFSKEKRPPVGFKPFVEACIDAGAASEAAKYIPKLTDAGEKAEYYARIGMVREAEEAAEQAKDEDLLGRIRNTFGQNVTAVGFLDSLRDRLSLQG